MIEKITGLLKSIRFWQVTVIAVIQVFAFYIPEFKELANIISAWLGIVVTIGTVDAAVTKFGGALKGKK